ncbi:MAG TPA: hypothetical protein VGJ60_07300 [Chloroflexota bacterium]
MQPLRLIVRDRDGTPIAVVELNPGPGESWATAEAWAYIAWKRYQEQQEQAPDREID